MISAKKLIKLARKWQKLGAIKHKKIALPRMSQEVDTNDCSTSSFVEKGHFVVYSADQKRFMLPLEYLKKEIVRQLFKLAEEEFGVPSNGPLILPCDAVFLQYRNNKMISAKKLIKLARKWQKLGAIKHKKIALPRMSQEVDTNDCSTSSFVEKGHFVVYSADQKRFMLPLEYLKKEIVRQLFKLAEEEFGVPSNGPLILPCDAVFLQYVISLIKLQLTKDVEKAFLTSIASGHCSSSSCLHQESRNQPSLIRSF
ncbi:Small auxin-up RNA - like 10 [Theobroma cacao]|nr:Small auxin-up RNA - like 10 [Theobroma cacao]